MIDYILDMQIIVFVKDLFVFIVDNTLYLIIDKKYITIMDLFKMKQCIHLDSYFRRNP